MANKKFLLGILVLALVFGMTVIGCEEEEEDEGTPYPQSISIDVHTAWWYTVEKEPKNGRLEIVFFPPSKDANITYTGTPAKVSVEDLAWLQESDITLGLDDVDNRTVLITSIEKKDLGGSVSVQVNLTRSAEPSGTESTATVSITFPDDFTAKYPDGITWVRKTFTF